MKNACTHTNINLKSFVLKQKKQVPIIRHFQWKHDFCAICYELFLVICLRIGSMSLIVFSFVLYCSKHLDYFSGIVTSCKWRYIYQIMLQEKLEISYRYQISDQSKSWSQIHDRHTFENDYLHSVNISTFRGSKNSRTIM